VVKDNRRPEDVSDEHCRMGAKADLAVEYRSRHHGGRIRLVVPVYAQWTGPLRLLDLKVPCLVTTIDECSFFQSRLDDFHASGPAYQPAIWWIGMATFLAGRASGCCSLGSCRIARASRATARRTKAT